VCSHVFEFTSCRSSSVTCMGMDVSTTVISFTFFDIFMALSIDASSSTSSLQLHAYSDTTWGSDPSSFKSLSAYCVFCGSSLIAWKTKKQTIVSRCSAEAELRALACVTAEVTCLWWLLADFGVAIPTTLVHCDSTSAISIAQDPVKHELTKHVGVDCFYVRSGVQDKIVAL
jgi:hypothetical protein